jgi:hypothetical protein
MQMAYSSESTASGAQVLLRSIHLLKLLSSGVSHGQTVQQSLETA